ncbi:MAG: hypothetical protein DYG89_46660 [Caldilinea sp. CFX5]|nr:hypothetical protein [Caldilinea sp. CFX5]
MRYFNTFGPVDEQKHYVVTRADLIANLLMQIEEGHYFTIFAPRQMGKTTLMRNLRDHLQESPTYLPIPLSFQLFENWSVEDFLSKFGEWITQHLLHRLPADYPNFVQIQTLCEEKPPNGYKQFWDFFITLQTMAPTLRVVLLIDEFDATPQAAISSLLQTWREFYLAVEPPRSLHSVVLIGLQNIARLNLGRSSPFNIARQVRLAAFTEAQVEQLLTQYSAESNQPFAPGVMAKIHQQTGGHPFLVNRLAAILTTEVAMDRTQPITIADLDRAQQQLVRESNYNFETLARHAREQSEFVLDILFGKPYPFNLNDPLVQELYTEGVINSSAVNNCQIANPIYRQVLTAYFRPRQLLYQRDILVNGHDFRAYATGDALQMNVILHRFREFIERRGREAFKVSPMPQEATGQYLLMAYLEAIVQQTGGVTFTEAPSGDGLLDLIVVYGKQRYIIETKIWRGQVQYERGLAQLEDYLAKEGLATGYFVVFHARPNVYGDFTQDQLEFVLERPNGMTIYVYLVRLGKVIGETADTQPT